MENTFTDTENNPELAGLVKLRQAKEEAGLTQAITDIDPSDWLSHNDNLVLGRVKTRAGSLKIAGLSEPETDQARRMSMKAINPGLRNSGKEPDMKLTRLWTVVLSVNKAYGLSLNDPNALTIEKVEASRKLSGEITKIVEAISALSGYGSEEDDPAGLERIFPEQ